MFEDFFYERLTKLRLENGVSAREMSLSLGQSAGYINKIENRKALPSLSGFFYICEYLKITPQEFFDEENNNPKLVQDIIGELKNLNDEQLLSIFTLIKNFNKEK